MENSKKEKLQIDIILCVVSEKMYFYTINKPAYMNKYIFIFLSVWIIGCTNAKKTQNKGNLQGNWVNQDVIDSLLKYKSFKNIDNYYCTEFIVHTQDSIYFINGQIEGWESSYKTVNDTQIEVKEFGVEKLTNFFINPEKTQLFIEDKVNKKKHNFQRIKAYNWLKNANGIYEAFPRIINEKLFAGEYKVVNDTGNITDQKISFETDGTVKGINNFKRYKICINGDCQCIRDADMIEFSTDSKQNYFEPIGWDIPKGWAFKGDTLIFYNLKNLSLPDEKGDYIKDGIYLKLLKRK